jgi:hypothetical protein
VVQEPHFHLIIEVVVHDDGQQQERYGAGEVEVLEHEADAVFLARTAVDLAPLI